MSFSKFADEVDSVSNLGILRRFLCTMISIKMPFLPIHKDVVDNSMFGIRHADIRPEDQPRDHPIEFNRRKNQIHCAQCRAITHEKIPCRHIVVNARKLSSRPVGYDCLIIGLCYESRLANMSFDFFLRIEFVEIHSTHSDQIRAARIQHQKCSQNQKSIPAHFNCLVSENWSRP
jgi:hypothetical protein